MMRTMTTMAMTPVITIMARATMGMTVTGPPLMAIMPTMTMTPRCRPGLPASPGMPITTIMVASTRTPGRTCRTCACT